MSWIYAKGSLSRCCCDQEDVYAVFPQADLDAAIEKIVTAPDTLNYKVMRSWNEGKSDKEIFQVDQGKKLAEAPGRFVEDADILVRSESTAKFLVDLLNSQGYLPGEKG